MDRGASPGVVFIVCLFVSLILFYIGVSPWLSLSICILIGAAAGIGKFKSWRG